MENFGSRLRYERERRQIDLRSIAETTKISVPLLEGLERDDVSRWPCGIFRKSFIRSYAQAIGLDPEPVVREFMERYPDPLEAEANLPAPVQTPAVRQPFAIKLTIAWSGWDLSPFARLRDRKIARLLSHWKFAK